MLMISLSLASAHFWFLFLSADKQIAQKIASFLSSIVQNLLPDHSEREREREGEGGRVREREGERGSMGDKELCNFLIFFGQRSHNEKNAISDRWLYVFLS
jgi:hypothetical protein